MTPIDIPTTQISAREVERYRRHYDRRRLAGTVGLVLAAIASAGVLVLAMMGCGSAPAGHPVVTAPPTQVAAVIPLAVQIQTWYRQGGQSQINAVSADMLNIARDPLDGRAMRIDGEQLREDATIAGGNLPPGDSRLYLRAMSDEEAAGAWFAEGSAEVAVTPETRGERELGRWTTVLQGELGQ